MNVFYSKDGVRGHCLPCLDLERGRDAGTCPLLSYKHYMDKLNGIKSRKCYSYFEDLDDMFDPQVSSRCCDLSIHFLFFFLPQSVDRSSQSILRNTRGHRSAVFNFRKSNSTRIPTAKPGGTVNLFGVQAFEMQWPIFLFLEPISIKR